MALCLPCRGNESMKRATPGCGLHCRAFDEDALEPTSVRSRPTRSRRRPLPGARLRDADRAGLGAAGFDARPANQPRSRAAARPTCSSFPAHVAGEGRLATVTIGARPAGMAHWVPTVPAVALAVIAPKALGARIANMAGSRAATAAMVATRPSANRGAADLRRASMPLFRLP